MVLPWLFADRIIVLLPRQRYERTPEILLVPRAGGGAVAAVPLPNP